MFSSFKEKLNTSLSTLQEKGLSTPASTSQTNGTDRRSLDTGAGTGAPGKIEPLTIQSETSAETTSGTGPENAVDPVKTADLTSLASPHSPTPSVPQPLPIPQQGSFGSIASRISSSASSSSLFFRRPLQATRSTADLVAASSAVPISTLSTSLPSSGSHSFLDSTMPSSHRLATLVQKLTLDPQEETVDPAELDKVREFYSQQQQSSGTELSTVVIEKLEVLRRYEARFPGEKKPIDSNKYHYFNNNHHYSSSNDNNDDTISSGNTLRKKKKRTQKKVVEEEEDLAMAFKKIVQEKIAAETVLKASTPLEDLADVDALEAHLQNMVTKNEMSMQEIKRLSEELRQTLKAKEEESASQAAIIENLRAQISEFEKSGKSMSFVDIDLDADTKVNTSFDLSAGPPPSTPSTPPPQTNSLPSTTPPTPVVSSPPPSSKPKRSKDPEKKNQALRELMIRLEAVLQEKNQAKEDQEEAVEQVRELQSKLDQEIQLNKDISNEVEQLRTTVIELESRVQLDKISAESVTSEAMSTLEESIRVARSEAETALAAKKELETKLSTLQESISQKERTLETAKNQIKELGDVSKQLSNTKMELDDVQEDLQEKQRLLDLERQWREEAEKSRDGMKREYDMALKNTQRVLEEAEEKSKTLGSRIEQAVSDAIAGSNEKVAQLQSTISQLEERLVVVHRERSELEQSLSEKSNQASEIKTFNDRIACLEREIAVLTSEKDSLTVKLTEAEATIALLKSQLADSTRTENRLNSDSPSTVDNEVFGNNNNSSAANPTVQTLQSKIEQLETELQKMAQSPSLNDLKQLHDELYAVKQAKAEADEIILALQTEVKAITEASEAAKESDASISLEELSSLKQERAELSEKLTRLERLHQGFERSSSERIQALEQELSVLLEQKAVLEAQVQEQSNLLVREKAKEKELEQARVAEDIDRVTLELAAVRTAERFASSKVTELAKERDLVAEKVVKLEKHLEKLRECKVGQEQDLTGRIQKLTFEKESLEKQVQTLQQELDRTNAQYEEKEKEKTEEQARMSEERDRAIAKVAELEQSLHTMTEESNAALSARLEQDKDKEQLTALTLELKSKSKKLAIAQEQAQVQRTMHADKITQLMDQITALKTERDSLSQPKIELETQLAQMTEKAERLEQQVKVMEADAEQLLLAKTEAQEQVSELQTRINALGLKERDLKDALALAKETMNHRDEDLSLAQKQLKKAVSDLDKAQQKLAKVEQSKKSLEEEISTLKSSHSKNQQEAKTQANLAANQHSTTSKELQRLKATHVKILQERDQLQKERDHLAQEKETGHQELERNLEELKTLKTMHESAETQMREYQSQLTEARNRVDTLEELTSIAKRVAETKVAELEQLKAKMVESEQDYVRAKSQLKTKDDEYRAQKEKFRAEIEETRQVLGDEITELNKQLEKTNVDSTTLRELSAQQSEELEATRSRLEEQATLVDSLEKDFQEIKLRKRDLELELQHFKDLEEIMAKDRSEHSAAVEDFKMREGHLRTINKTLKEEIRKLQKLSPGSPLPSPTSPHAPYNSQSNIPSTPTPATPRPRAADGGPQILGRAATMSLPVTPRWSPSHAKAATEEDVNIEYLKNVLLNFMEHKERRQQLIPVVAQMLRLSSDETKRFSKVV